MSRKDYEAIAEVFAWELKNLRRPIIERHVLREVAMALCAVFIRDNSAFNKERFMQACGFNE